MMHMKSADSCLLYGIRAKAIADRQHYAKGKADAVCNIATALFLKGVYSQALELYTEAMLEYKSVSDTVGTVQMLMNSAVVYEVLGDTLNSVKFSRRALIRASALYSDSIKCMLYANYSFLRPKSEPDSSAFYLNQAEKIALQFKDERALLFIKQLKSEKLTQTGQLAQARELILGSLQIARRHQWEYHEIVGLDYYAQYFLKQNQIDSAIACYHKSYELADRSGFITFKAEVLKSLRNCYQLKGDEKNQALTNERLVQALEEEKNSNNGFIGDYIAYHNTQQQVEQLELQAKNNRRTIGLLVGFSLLAIGVIIFIFVLYKKLRQQARLQHQLNEKITEQNKLLTQSDEFKAKLVSMLAHDFRSPLNSTLSMISLLKDEYVFTKEELETFYSSLQMEIETVLRTFDNILQWVKKQYSGFVATPENVVVHSAIEEAASLHHTLMQDKNISLVNRIDEDVAITTDREVIQFINRNLIHNAIKFSPAGGSITVDADYSNQDVIVSVADKGIGMTQEQIDKLFAFTVSDHSGIDRSAGVALTICRDFITKLNGRIWAESSPGRGTTFYYALPQRVSPTIPTAVQME
ncbi:ATP-binding protein [Larkinella insperata]|uniref:histidine kinase n=1 Tax=Larkinella insperata TaxID=332158 RepID=A0ABW3Q924_9BACT|nr:HAMP domain-containing sensor histidine kinase [Larkinella insperata]